MCLPLSHPLSSPFPFPLCVCHVIHPHVCVSPFPCLVLSSLCVCEARHMHCVCAACHTPTLCPAVLLPLLSSLSVSLPPPSPSFLGASEREKGVWGKGERGRREVCHPKRHAKRQHKHSKKKTTPGVPTLSPTLVQTTPFHPSLHSSHHKSCFPLGVAVTVSPKAHTRFSHQHKR